MNLQAAIGLLDLMAGGPGSGCRGGNCGRHVKQQFTTPTGIRVTMVKERGRQERRPRNPNKTKHPLKGQFSKLEKHYGSGLAKPGQNLRTWVADAKVDDWSKHMGAKGATVFVHRYADTKTRKPTEIVVDEHNWIGHRWRYSNPVRRSFRNAGRAAGYVKRRYGLAIPIREYVG